MVANAGVNVGEPFLAKDTFSAGGFGLGLLIGGGGRGARARAAYLAGSWIDGAGSGERLRGRTRSDGARHGGRRRLPERLGRRGLCDHLGRRQRCDDRL